MRFTKLSTLIRLAHRLAEGRQIASVAVVRDGDMLLMGLRRDNMRWTLPGGHIDPGEEAHAGGLRELREEAGILAEKLTLMGAETITGRAGDQITVHAFRLDLTSAYPTTIDDPDKEVYSWEWIPIASGLPANIAANLHSPKNIVLQKLGLQT